MSIRNNRTPPPPKPNATRIGGGQQETKTGTPSTQVAKTQGTAPSARSTGMGAIKDRIDNSGPSAAGADAPNDDADLNVALNKATNSSGQLRRSSGKSPSIQSKPSSNPSGKKNNNSSSSSSSKSSGRASGGRKAGGRSKSGQDGPIENASGLKNIRGAEGNQEEPSLGDEGRRLPRPPEQQVSGPNKVALGIGAAAAASQQLSDISPPQGEALAAENTFSPVERNTGESRSVPVQPQATQAFAESARSEATPAQGGEQDLEQRLSAKSAPAFRTVVERAPNEGVPSERNDDNISPTEEKAFQQLVSETPKEEVMHAAQRVAADGEVAPELVAADLAQREVENHETVSSTSFETGPVRVPAGIEGAEEFQKVAVAIEDDEPVDGVLLDGEMRAQAAERGAPFVQGGALLSGNGALVHAQVRDMANGLKAQGQNASDIQSGMETLFDSDGGGDEGDDAEEEADE